MKVRFTSDAVSEGKVVFKKDSIEEMADTSGQRWIRRGVAQEYHSGEIVGKIKEVVSAIASAVSSDSDKSDSVKVGDKHSAPVVEAGHAQDSDVANTKVESENSKIAKQAQATKGHVKGH